MNPYRSVSMVDECFCGQDVEKEWMRDSCPTLRGNRDAEEFRYRTGPDHGSPIGPNVRVGWVDAAHEGLGPYFGRDMPTFLGRNARSSARRWRGVRGDGRTFIRTDGTGRCESHIGYRIHLAVVVNS